MVGMSPSGNANDIPSPNAELGISFGECPERERFILLAFSVALAFWTLDDSLERLYGFKVPVFDMPDCILVLPHEDISGITKLGNSDRTVRDDCDTNLHFSLSFVLTNLIFTRTNSWYKRLFIQKCYFYSSVKKSGRIVPKYS